MFNSLFLYCLKGKKILNLYRLIGYMSIIIMLKYLYLKKILLKMLIFFGYNGNICIC